MTILSSPVYCVPIIIHPPPSYMYSKIWEWITTFAGADSVFMIHCKKYSKQNKMVLLWWEWDGPGLSIAPDKTTGYVNENKSILSRTHNWDNRPRCWGILSSEQHAGGPWVFTPPPTSTSIFLSNLMAISISILKTQMGIPQKNFYLFQIFLKRTPPPCSACHL